MGKERPYSAKPSITTGDGFRASLPGLDLLLGMGAGGGPWGPQAIGPNPVPTLSSLAMGSQVVGEDAVVIKSDYLCFVQFGPSYMQGQ
jgi:hypothetical protein